MSTNVTLEDRDAAIIFREDGSLESVFSKYKDDERVAYKDVLVTAISARIVSDGKFADQQVEWLERQVAKERSKRRKKHPTPVSPSVAEEPDEQVD